MKVHWLVLLAGFVLAVVGLARGCVVASAQDNQSPSSTWGGDNVALEITAAGVTLEFDCAHGAIAQPLRADAAGDFSVTGTFTPERGGPVQRNNVPKDLPAVYKGTIKGDTMQLEIILDDKTQAPQNFTLTKGKAGRVRKCR